MLSSLRTVTRLEMCRKIPIVSSLNIPYKENMFHNMMFSQSNADGSMRMGSAKSTNNFGLPKRTIFKKSDFLKVDPISNERLRFLKLVVPENLVKTNDSLNPKVVTSESLEFSKSNIIYNGDPNYLKADMFVFFMCLLLIWLILD